LLGAGGQFEPGCAAKPRILGYAISVCTRGLRDRFRAGATARAHALALACDAQDGFEDGLSPGERVIVPEAQCMKTIAGKTGVADFVGGRIQVLATVELDDERDFKADEIKHVETEWMLAAEAMAGELAILEMAPEVAFGLGLVAAQVAGQVALGAVAHGGLRGGAIVDEAVDRV
jgi:hypothetical protein